MMLTRFFASVMAGMVLMAGLTDGRFATQVLFD
jgi:hypothetical protein